MCTLPVDRRLVASPRELGRWFVIVVSNEGLGIAKFPSIRFQRSLINISQYGLDGNGGFGLPVSPSESDWIVFRGGVDDVIYSQETRKVLKVWQTGSNVDADGLPYPTISSKVGNAQTSWVFNPMTFKCDISCEGVPTISMEKSFAERSEVIPTTRVR